MPVLIIAPDDQPVPSPFVAPIIETKSNWGDDWAFNPDITLVTCIAAAGSGMSECEIERRYGQGKFPQDAITGGQPYQKRKPLSLIGTWVRFSVVGQESPDTPAAGAQAPPPKPQVQFVGQIMSQADDFKGTDKAPSGHQRWVAYGGLKRLEKIVVSESVWLVGTQPKIIGWIPGMNKRDHRGMLVGNRTTDPNTQFDYYGVPPDDSGAAPGNNTLVVGVRTGSTPVAANGVWSHWHYLQYVLREFVNSDGNPVFTLSGHTSILLGLSTTIDFPEAINVAEMLKLLIPVKYGIDFHIAPTETGFEIFIFSLAPNNFSVAGVTFPANPNLIQLNRAKQIQWTYAQIVDSAERKVDFMEVVGKRIVVCGTIGGKKAPYGAGQLLPRWSAAIEKEYISAAGEADKNDFDIDAVDTIRKREKYRDVYQHFGAPQGWDMAGAWNLSCDNNGVLQNGAPFQNLVRNTLSWIPLKTGFSYFEDPPQDNNFAGVEPDFQHPLAWVRDEDVDETGRDDAGGKKPVYVQCNFTDPPMHVGHPHLDWGIVVDANPNEALALNHWTAGQFGTSAIENPRYDYDTLVATIALESDQRVRVAYQLPAGQRAGDNSVMTIVDHEAEMWVLLPNTVIDVSTGAETPGIKKGDLLTTGGRRILRDDTPRLKLALAGAVLRYQIDRAKGNFVINDFLPWMLLIGQLLDVYQQGDIVKQIGAPITSVEWIMGKQPQMIVKAGYS